MGGGEQGAGENTGGALCGNTHLCPLLVLRTCTASLALLNLCMPLQHGDSQHQARKLYG